MIDNKPVYLCDPEKNKLCDKEGCYISGGPCSHTFNKAYEKKQTNQDKLAEMVRTMDPEILAKYIRESITCGEDCPVMDICKPKKGETCCDLIESWLKEDAE